MHVWLMVYEFGAVDICYIGLIKLLWHLSLHALLISCVF